MDIHIYCGIMSQDVCPRFALFSDLLWYRLIGCHKLQGYLTKTEQSCNCLNVSKTTQEAMGTFIARCREVLIHNHNKMKHEKSMYIFDRKYCVAVPSKIPSSWQNELMVIVTSYTLSHLTAIELWNWVLLCQTQISRTGTGNSAVSHYLYIQRDVITYSSYPPKFLIKSQSGCIKCSSCNVKVSATSVLFCRKVMSLQPRRQSKCGFILTYDISA